MDVATTTTELTERRDASPVFEAAEPAEAVLADSEISDGVEPLIKSLPHVELKLVKVDPGIKPGKSLFAILNACLEQSEQVMFLGTLELPLTIICMRLVMLRVPTEF